MDFYILLFYFQDIRDKNIIIKNGEQEIEEIKKNLLVSTKKK